MDVVVVVVTSVLHIGSNCKITSSLSVLFDTLLTPKVRLSCLSASSTVPGIRTFTYETCVCLVSSSASLRRSKSRHSSRSKSSKSKSKSKSRSKSRSGSRKYVQSCSASCWTFVTVCEFCLMSRGSLKCNKIGVFASCDKWEYRRKL